MTRKRKPTITYGKRSRPQRALSLSSDGLEMFFPNSNEIDTSQKPPPPFPPRKPASQKAASMPSEPEEDKIETFISITDGMPRAEAVRYLKAKNNNLEQAIDAFFNGEDISKLESATQWDDSVWSAGKDGDAGTGSNDHLLRPLASSAAGTRPNSPAPSTRSNLRPTTQQQEDDDLAQAMAMSRGEDVAAFGGYSHQETGVVEAGTGGAVFGPATKEHYDTNQWAMVPLGGASVGMNEEVIPDTSIEDRVNTGEPRMLKPLPGGDYTASLLTICANIEGAREALLMREHVLPNYGQDADWWRGHSISLPKIVHMEDGRQAEPESDNQDEILAEVQRLMALLSSSRRSYGSAQALTQTNVIESGTPASTQSRTLLEMVLEQWAVAASAKSSDPEAVTSLFSTTVGTNDPEGMNRSDMSLVNMQVFVQEGETMELFEALDHMLWNTDAVDSNMADNYIERPAGVLVMRAYQASAAMGKELRVQVQPQFYVDKYLKENIEATRKTRQDMAKCKERIKKIADIETKLNYWKHPKTGALLDKNQLLKHTLGHFSGQNRMAVAAADKANNVAVPDETPEEPAHYPEVTAKLEKIVASIDDKLKVLASEKEKTRQIMTDLSRAPPPGVREEDQKHRYTLRGVATKPNITYVTVPKDPNAEGDDMLDGDVPSDYRWWRLEYDTNAAGGVAKVTKTPAGDYDVLRAVELEHHSALLVYASERMNNPNLISFDDDEKKFELPPPLAAFIQTDDGFLDADIESAATAELPAYNMSLSDDRDIPRPSIERTSMDSTRAEHGDVGGGFGEPSPPAYGDDMFENHHSFGLGPDIKQGYSQMDVDAEGEVHEIKLDDNDDDGVEEIEMVEKGQGQVGWGHGSGKGEKEEVEW